MDGSVGYWDKKGNQWIIKGLFIGYEWNGHLCKFEHNTTWFIWSVLIGMDFLDAHHVILYCRNKSFTCLDGEVKQNLVKGIPRPSSIREILAFQLKRCFRKGFHMYVAHVQEIQKCKISILEDFIVLQDLHICFKKYKDLHRKEILI